MSIDAALAQVDWAPTNSAPTTDGSRYATHSGVLDVLGFEFRVYRLNTGEAVIHADDMERFFAEGRA
ncbi:MAG: hypothetical protein J0M00_13245 [Burkholderiales bacterium]|nr:hypothetical protein [Burkholderiales bacterium]